MSRLSLISRIKYWVQLRRSGLRLSDEDERMQSIHRAYLRLIARHRAATIAIALRRHKDKAGRWPSNLEEIKSFAPPEIFIDPLNGGSFAYRIAGDTFKLYSKGQNKIDEDGQHNSKSHPYIFEVEVKEDDILFWQPTIPRTREKNTNTQLTDPNANQRE